MNQSKKSKFLYLQAIICVLILSTTNARAQQSAKVKNSTLTYILPDGRAISEDKLDSVRGAWGADNVIMRHNDSDDAKGIIHLEQLTDKLLKEIAYGSAAQRKGLNDMIGQTAVDFTITDMNGREVQLSKLKGKIVVLNFWFVNCPPCIAELPELNELVKTFKKQGVVFLGITFDDSQKVSSFLKSHLFNYQVLPGARNITNAYGIHNYPSHLVIGRDGNLKQYFVSGENIKTELEKVIRKLHS